MRCARVAQDDPGNDNVGMTPTALAHKVTEHDPVRRWRLEELMRAGYAPPDALVLSRRQDVDLHLAIRLLADGCPTETAVRILF